MSLAAKPGGFVVEIIVMVGAFLSRPVILKPVVIRQPLLIVPEPSGGGLGISGRSRGIAPSTVAIMAAVIRFSLTD